MTNKFVFNLEQKPVSQEKVHVMKVVDLVTRNSDQLSLHFSDFSTNLYRFYKFTALEKPKRKKEFFAQRPLDFCFFSGKVPGGLDRTGERFARHFPARSGPRG